jgi:hypothetical protein
LQAEEQTRQAAETRAAELAQREKQLQDELAAFAKAEEDQIARLNSLRAQTAEKQAAALQSTAVHAENQIAFEEAHARLLEQEQAQKVAEARAAELAQQEQQLNAQLESLRANEQEQITRIDDLKSRVREQEEALQYVLNEAKRQANEHESRIAELQQARAQTEAQARERAGLAESLMDEINALESVNSDMVLDLFDEQPPDEIKGIEPMFDLGAFESNDQVERLRRSRCPGWKSI